MKSVEAIRTFFERKDTISPNGGRPMSNAEVLAFARGNQAGATKELAEACAKELGVEIEN